MQVDIHILQKCNLKESKKTVKMKMKSSIYLKEPKNRFTAKEFKITNTISNILKLNNLNRFKKRVDLSLTRNYIISFKTKME